MEDENEQVSDRAIDIKEMLELQLSEIEMLTSMFPNPGEFKLDDPAAIDSIQMFVKDKIDYQYLYARLGFTLKIEPQSMKYPAEMVCHYPHEYPTVSPEVFIRSPPQMNRENHRKLNEDLHEFLSSIEKGEICMFSVIEWIQENIDHYVTEDTVTKGNKSEVEFDTVFSRLWIYSHHIYSKFKRRDIIEWAEELKLTGFSLPGKPGVICVEGYSRNVDEYWHRLRRLNWKKLAIKEKEDQDIGDDSIVKYRKFPNFEEKNFEVRGGKGREYHMDLGILYEFLQKLGCGHIFAMYFGVDGKPAAAGNS